MKLTPFGKDYLFAVVLLVAIGGAVGEQLFAALALGMAFAAVVSFVIFRLRRRRVVELSAEAPALRAFKRGEARTLLSIPGLLDAWSKVELGSAAVGGDAEASLVPAGDGKAELIVRPSLSGRFTGVKVTLGIHDTLGLFAKWETRALSGVVIDSLPLSLLAPPRRAFTPPIAIGEIPAGTAGKGQEFYGIEAYNERSEGKDILWKRAAANPEGTLMARVREANIPEAVMLVVVLGEVYEKTRAWLVDLECEAVGMLGVALLQAGVGVDIVAPDGTHHNASSEERLADSIMEASACRRGPEIGPPAPEGAAIFLTVGTVESGKLLSLGRHPVVFVGEARRGVDQFSACFTGVEALTRMVNMVLSR